MLAAYRNGESTDSEIEKDALFETVAQEVFVLYERLWKPGTLRVNRTYLHRQILPFFVGHMISAITQQDVAAWFPVSPCKARGGKSLCTHPFRHHAEGRILGLQAREQ